MSTKIYILDEIVVQESKSALLRDEYMRRYVPSAKCRGMHLEGAWRSPPIEIADRSATLHFLWSVPDVGGWWAMRLGKARANTELDVGIEGDVEKTNWWRFVDSVAVSRKRKFMVDL